jgi:hypothetical protein
MARHQNPYFYDILRFNENPAGISIAENQQRRA